MNYQEMQDRRAEASKENADLLSFEEGADPILTDDQRELSNKLETEIATLTANIDQYEADQVRRDRQTALTATLATTTRLPSTTLQQPTVNDPLAASAEAKPKITFPRSYGKLKAFKGPGAADNAFKAGQFLLAVPGNNVGAQEWCRSNGVDMLAQNEGSNQAGGFLVPPEFATAIIDLREEHGVARREMNIEPMAGETRTVPRVVTGLTAYYVDEADDITESQASWDQVKLVAKKVGILAKYSSELNEDAIISMSDKLASEMARAFAEKEDRELFLGDGTSTYGGTSGLITEGAAATASVHTPVAGNSAFKTLDLDDFESMIGLLPMYAEAGAKWYISKAGWAGSMLRLIDAAGGNTGAMIAGAAPKEFLGYSVVLVNVMNSVLTAQTSVYGVCYLGDLTLASTFGNRRDITIAISEHAFFVADQIGIRGTERYAINVHDVGSTSKVGPIITLRMATT